MLVAYGGVFKLSKSCNNFKKLARNNFWMRDGTKPVNSSSVPVKLT